jgi:hypothetical protein
MLWRRYNIVMFRKLLVVFTVALLAAVVILPASALFSPFGLGFGLGFSPFGFSPFGAFGFSPFGIGTSFTTGFTTASSVTSGFTSVNGVAVPFGFGFSPFGFSPFGIC